MTGDGVNQRIYMKILVCGGRDFNNRLWLNKCLNKLHETTPITCVIHGGARGADSLAGSWANFNHILVKTYPADWNTYGKGAGFIRNRQMLNENPDLVVAFPGGRGTDHMIRTAKQHNFKVIQYIEG